MTSLGFPGLSSQSASGLFGPFRPENPKTDWDDKPGLPRVVIPVRFLVFGPFRPENPETDWDDKLGLPRLVTGFSGILWPENPETDWDDKPGLPRLVIPVCFRTFKPRNGVGRQAWEAQACHHPSPFRVFFSPFWPKRTGMTSLGFPGLSSQSVSGFVVPFLARKPRNGLG